MQMHACSIIVQVLFAHVQEAEEIPWTVTRFICGIF